MNHLLAKVEVLLAQLPIQMVRMFLVGCPKRIFPQLNATFQLLYKMRSMYLGTTEYGKPSQQ